MKFTVEKCLVQEAFRTTSRAVAARSTIPAITGLKFEGTSEGRVSVTGYDMTTGVKSYFDAPVEDPGAVVIPSKLLDGVLKKAPDEVLSFDFDDLSLCISCGRTKFNIQCLDAEAFPALPDVGDGKSIYLTQSVLKRLVSQTVYAASQDDRRPTHMGCLFKVAGNTLEIAGVDGYRMALNVETIERPAAETEDFEFNVLGDSLREIQRILRNSDEVVTITAGNTHALFEIDSSVLISRLLEGEFLDYHKAMPKPGEQHISVTVNRRELLESIERAALVITESTKAPLCFTVGNGTLNVESKSDAGSVYDQLTIEGGTVDELQIGFNAKYFMEALKALECENVYMKLESAVSPCVITPLGEEGSIHMVLPVRLKKYAG